jgi:ADP-ribosylglycohydrolase
MMLNAVLGDALGSAFDGLGKAHIKSIFKEISGFTDPAEAIRDYPERWKKPGLYTSISQFMLLASMSFTRRRFNERLFTESIISSPEIVDLDHGIFRNPGQLEKTYIRRIKKSAINLQIPDQPEAGIMLIALPFAFNSFELTDLISGLIPLARSFTSNSHTVSGALILASLLKELTDDDPPSGNLADFSCVVNDRIMSLISSSSGDIFRLGVNPDSLLDAHRKFGEIFENLKNADDRDKAEHEICRVLNSILKTHVKRATVNHPLSILPYSIFMADITGPSELLFAAAGEGGCASCLASICGAIIGCRHAGKHTPPVLVRNLVNKKRILSICENISERLEPGIIPADFIKSEELLTIKELDELKSRLKHAKDKKKKPSRPVDRERELSKHVVESWTKIDKAKWKKDREKKGRD